MGLFASRRRIASDLVARSAFVAVLLLAFPAAAPAATSSGIPAAGTPLVAERPGLAHVLIARDPESGGWTLAPLVVRSEREALELDAAMAINQSVDGLVTEALPGGGYAMDLEGRFQSYSLARRDAAGVTLFGCEGDALSLFRWLSEVPPAVDVHGRPLR